MKTVLVICSNDDENPRKDSYDFPRQASEILGNSWKTEWHVTFLSPAVNQSQRHIKGFFPKDAPRLKFNLIWFCGCDGLYSENNAILVTDAIKVRLRKGGMVLFTDIHGDILHKYNIELKNGWKLDVRAYNDAAMKHKKEMKEWLDEDDFAKQFYTKALQNYRETCKLVKLFLTQFKRNKLGFYEIIE